MNRKTTEKRKIEWLEVIPIAIIVISSMVVGWIAFNKAYDDYKKQNSMRQIRAEIEQTLKECERDQKEWKQRQKEWEQRIVPK